LNGVGAAFEAIEALLQQPDQDYEQAFSSKKASFTGGLSMGLSAGYDLGQQHGLMQRLGSSMPEQPQLLNCKGLQSGMPGIEQLFTVSVGEVKASIQI
jgi:hypothetical protein